MEDKPKKVYKSKTCAECNLTFKINYYYTHKKSKKHIANCNKLQLNLLEINNTDIMDDLKRMTDDIESQIISVKKILQKRKEDGIGSYDDWYMDDNILESIIEQINFLNIKKINI